jgi:hypothetical protein
VFSEIPRGRIALETGTHATWIRRQLGQYGHEVIVAHARQLRLISESRGKTIGWKLGRWDGWPESIPHCSVRCGIAVPSHSRASIIESLHWMVLHRPLELAALLIE